jgi:hypothetical protein
MLEESEQAAAGLDNSLFGSLKNQENAKWCAIFQPEPPCAVQMYAGS